MRNRFLRWLVAEDEIANAIGEHKPNAVNNDISLAARMKSLRVHIDNETEVSILPPRLFVA